MKYQFIFRGDALGKAVKVCWFVLCLPLWFKMKYLYNYWMDYHEILVQTFMFSRG